MNNPWSVRAELAQLAGLLQQVGDLPPSPGPGSG